MNSNVIGQYQLLEKIDQGGMAEIYRARRSGPHGFEKIVAIKKILPHLANDQDFINMFSSEAKVTAQLQHRNIVQIEDYGKEGGIYYLAMEYIHGLNLNDLMTLLSDSHQTLSLPQISYVIKLVCAALEYAHFLTDFRGRSLAIVHRDINPKNIMISFTGEIKLMDFGIALASTRSFQTLADGMIKGKIAYISPEQVKSEDLDHRSDIFSLGIVMYELVTGVRPFQSNTDFGILKKIEQAVFVPPEQLVSNLPHEFSKIITKCLSRDKRNRYYSTGDIRLALEKIENSSGMRTDQPSFRKFLESVLGKDVVHSPLIGQNASFPPVPDDTGKPDDDRWGDESAQTVMIDRSEQSQSRTKSKLLHEPTRIIPSSNVLTYPPPKPKTRPPTDPGQSAAPLITNARKSSHSVPPPPRMEPRRMTQPKPEPEIPEGIVSDLDDDTLSQAMRPSARVLHEKTPGTDPGNAELSSKEPGLAANDETAFEPDITSEEDEEFFDIPPTRERSHFGLIIALVLIMMSLGGVFLFGWAGILKILGLAETEFHGALTVKLIPSDATMQIDFVDQTELTKPINIAWPFNSSHGVLISHPDYKAVSFNLVAPPDSTGDITVNPADTTGVSIVQTERKITLDVHLSPQYLKISVKSTPKGAKVFVNGVDTQKTTPFEFPFDVDSDSTVRFLKEGYEPLETSFRPNASKPDAGLSVELKKSSGTVVDKGPNEPTPAPATGRVIIKSSYPVTIASAKGVLASSVKEKTVVLLTGKQTLKITNPDVFLDLSKTVQVTDSKPVTINIEPLGKMIVEADPPGCKVSINDQVLGTAPGQFELAPGLYNVMFKWDQCEASESRWVKVVSEQNKKVPKVMGCK